MTVCEESFKNGMRYLGAAVHIVTTADGDAWAGLTATAVCSLSAQPPRLLACINRRGITFETVTKARNLAVNLLCDDQISIAQRFAGMMQEDENDRFDKGLWAAGQSGAPILKSALVSFDCQVEQIIDGGTHAIVIGNVVDVLQNQQNKGPLIYLDGQWGQVHTNP